jgi:hypothetical protein
MPAGRTPADPRSAARPPSSAYAAVAAVGSASQVWKQS